MVVTGDGIGESYGIYRRKNETKFGHVNYVHENQQVEIFFERNEFNIGRPFSSDRNRINIRSESSMKQVFKLLGRSPCPNDLTYWKYRANDFIPFDYGKNIQSEFKVVKEILDHKWKFSPKTEMLVKILYFYQN